MGLPELSGLRRSLPLVKQLMKSSSATEAEASPVRLLFRDIHLYTDMHYINVYVLFMFNRINILKNDKILI